MLIFAGLAFLVCRRVADRDPLLQSGRRAGRLHVAPVLDEIYAVEWKGGRWRFKKSFGTAIKFWGDDGWSNFSTYAKLAIVAMFILGEPTVMQQLEASNPQFASQYQRPAAIDSGSLEPSWPAATKMLDAAPTRLRNFVQRARHRTSNRESDYSRSNGGIATIRRGDRSRIECEPLHRRSQPTQWQWPTDQRPAIRHGSAATVRSGHELRLQCSTPAVLAALHYLSAVSIHSVTGPSFTSDTSMCSRNLPVATSMPAARTRATKCLVQPLGQLRRRRIGEARPPAAAAIAVERELAHHEHRPAHLGQRAIHLARFVFEYSQADDLLRQPIHLRRRHRRAQRPTARPSPRPIRPVTAPSTVTWASLTR